MRGIYAVGRPGLTRRGEWMAAVLGCGPGAMLSHGSAAALWGFGDEVGREIEVSIRTASDRRRSDIRIHRRPGIRANDCREHDRVPVTSPVRTLIDQAARLHPLALERSVNEADKLDLADPEELRAALPRYSGERGVGVLQSLLDRQVFRLSDSDLEIFFRLIARDAGLPQPETKQMVNGFEVDFYWPDLGLVIETDGLRYHRTPSQQNRGLRRDQTHIATGITPLRFSHSQIKFEPDYVRAQLTAVAELLSRRQPR
jgi:very-short-patch-repair endonuclease